MKKLNSGFTLLELMITVAVLAVVLSLAAPGMQSMLESSQLKSTSEIFARSLTYARTEAATLHEQIVVCPSKDAKNCTTTAEYEIGIIIFSDKNGNGTPDFGSGECAVTEDCLLRYIDALPNDYTLRPSGTALNRVVFNGLGEFDVGDRSFFLCGPNADPTGDKESSYTLKISGSGSMGVVKGASKC